MIKSIQERQPDNVRREFKPNYARRYNVYGLPTMLIPPQFPISRRTLNFQRVYSANVTRTDSALFRKPIPRRGR